jgi:hypothetical protein
MLAAASMRIAGRKIQAAQRSILDFAAEKEATRRFDKLKAPSGSRGSRSQLQGAKGLTTGSRIIDVDIRERPKEEDSRRNTEYRSGNRQRIEQNKL